MEAVSGRMFRLGFQPEVLLTRPRHLEITILSKCNPLNIIVRTLHPKTTNNHDSEPSFWSSVTIRPPYPFLNPPSHRRRGRHLRLQIGPLCRHGNAVWNS